MTDVVQFRAALQRIMPELCAAVSDEHRPEVRAQLLALIDRLDNDKIDHRLFQLNVLRILRPFPDAKACLVEALDQPTGDDGDRSLWRFLPPWQRRVERELDVLCPPEVSLGEQRFTVILWLRVSRAPEHRTGSLVQVREDSEVVVLLDAPGFENLGTAEQRTRVERDRDSTPLVFELRPVRVGVFEICMELVQGGNTLGGVKLQVEVKDSALSEPAHRRAPVFVPARHGTPPARTLRVIYDRGHEGHSLRFELASPDQPRRGIGAVTLKGDPDRIMEHLYRELGLLASDCTSESRDLERKLQSLGKNLWAELIPAELDALYQQEREQWRGETLLLLSDEPWIPWELMWPWGMTWEDQAPWCSTLGLTRWLRPDARYRSTPGPETELCIQSAAVVTPGDSRLQQARKEQAWLLQWLHARGVQDVSPAPRRREVLEFLENGGFDWFHATAHGVFRAGHPDLEARLVLEGGEAITPLDIVGQKLVGHLNERRPGFFLNACSLARLGWGPSRLSGWASTLVRSGAGAVISALWPVKDESASHFAACLYHELSHGWPLAEATRRARTRVHIDGDPSWLAYAVYGHPNAVCRTPRILEEAFVWE